LESCFLDLLLQEVTVQSVVDVEANLHFCRRLRRADEVKKKKAGA